MPLSSQYFAMMPTNVVSAIEASTMRFAPKRPASAPDANLLADLLKWAKAAGADSADALYGIPDVDPAALKRTADANPELRWVQTMAAGGGGQVKAAGLRLIDEQPRIGIRGSRVAFLHPKATGGVLTELVEPAH